MKYDVFISYSSKDQKIAEGICGYLESNGYRCFVAYRDIPRGVVWASAIAEAIDESQMMVVVFSKDFNLSSQTDREIELASENKIPILTYRITDTEFTGAKKYYLKNINWIDAFPQPEMYFGKLQDNISRLLNRVDNKKKESSLHSFNLYNTNPKYNDWWEMYDMQPVAISKFKPSAFYTFILLILLIPLLILFLMGLIKCIGGVLEGENFCDGISENVLLGSFIGIVIVFVCLRNKVFINKLRKQRKELHDNDYIQKHVNRKDRYLLFARGTKSEHKFGLFDIKEIRIKIHPIYDELKWIKKEELLSAIKDRSHVTLDINGNSYQ